MKASRAIEIAKAQARATGRMLGGGARELRTRGDLQEIISKEGTSVARESNGNGLCAYALPDDIVRYLGEYAVEARDLLRESLSPHEVLAFMGYRTEGWQRRPVYANNGSEHSNVDPKNVTLLILLSGGVVSDRIRNLRLPKSPGALTIKVEIELMDVVAKAKDMSPQEFQTRYVPVYESKYFKMQYEQARQRCQSDMRP